MTKRVTFVITSEFHLRSFLTSRVMDYLGSAQISLVVHHSLVGSAKTLGLPVVQADFDSRLSDAYSNLFEAYILQDMFKSRSLKFRLRRMLLGDYMIPTISRAALSRWFRVGKGMTQRYRSSVLARYEALCRELADNIADSLSDGTHLVVAWATNYDPGYVVGYELAMLHKVPFIAVFDNWDNLSSKGILHRLPDRIVCFGTQSAKFAESIHGASGSQTLPLGSARFDAYQNYIVRNTSNSGDILFAGTSIPHEDARLIKKLRLSLVSESDSFSGNRVFYKPHPNPQSKVDWGIEGVHYLKSGDLGGLSQWETQEELAKTLAQFKVVVCGPTTLLLEAATLGIEVVIPSFASFGVWASNRRMLKMLEHLQGISTFQNVTVCRSASDFSRTIQSKLTTSGNGQEVDFDTLNNFVTFLPGETFGERLGKELSKVLARKVA